MTNTNQHGISYNVSQHEVEIINNLIELFLQGDDAIAVVKETAGKAITSAKKKVEKAEGSQLEALKEALKDFSGAMTEDAWDQVYKPKVTERLQNKYENAATRDVIVSRLKRATMGLTLAKEDPFFAPNEATASLRKYAEWVGPKLQKAIDPETGKPRLKSIATTPTEKKRKPLPPGQSYFLVGCASDAGDVSALTKDFNFVIAANRNLDRIADSARAALATMPSFKTFLVFAAPEPFSLNVWEEKKQDIEEGGIAFDNTAVIAKTYSPETARSASADAEQA